MNFCEGCGKEIDSDLELCSECQAELDKQEQTPKERGENE